MISMRSYAAPLTGAVAATIVAVLAFGGGTSGSAQSHSGLTYGARTIQGEHLWIRLRADRRAVAAIEVEWTIPASRCSNREMWWSTTSLGGENEGRFVPVRNGRFDARAIDRFVLGTGDRRADGVETFTISGTLEGTRISGTFSARATVTPRRGKPYACGMPAPLHYTAID